MVRITAHFCHKVNIIRDGAQTQDPVTLANVHSATTVYSGVRCDIAVDQRAARVAEAGEFVAWTHRLTFAHWGILYDLRAGDKVEELDASGTVANRYRIVTVGEGGHSCTLERSDPGGPGA